MLWIPFTFAAAFFQNMRSAIQRHLKSELTDLGAASVRFLYALPFALIWLAALTWVGSFSLPSIHSEFLLWVLGGSVSQIIFTVLLMWLFSLSNFTVGTALSKTEVVQVILLEALLLQTDLSLEGLIAIVIAFAGVIIMTIGKSQKSIGSVVAGLGHKTTMIGLLCGLTLGLSSVLFRGAALSLDEGGLLMRAAFTLAIATTIQSLILWVLLTVRQPGQIRKTLGHWRVCSLVGFAGWAASICWFMAFTLTQAAYVRALGQVELIFTFIASVFIFKEKIKAAEMAGVLLLIGAIVFLILERAV
ncbi:MAG: EamA family transporter [Arenicellales bacterium]|nr:DMT family transporter [Gammaproteobacteria bacterium]NDA14132.1 DMT family transporter [Gammaproteobacteria bacterium]NDG43911.1 DMT family transporter [Gammaproteobacteria bacterium]